MSDTTPVLLIGDDNLAIDETLRLASNPTLDIRHARETKVSIGLYDSFKPKIVLLAFTEPRQAIVEYGKLLLNVDNALNSPHLCILMIEGKYSQQASQYCHFNIIDDYVIFKPLFDTQRLSTSLYLLLRLYPLDNLENLIRIRCSNLIQTLGGITELIQPERIDLFRRDLDSISNPIVKDILQPNWAFNTFSQSPWSTNTTQETSTTALTDEPVTQKQANNDLMILVVEDEVVNQQMMTMVLEKENYQVILAKDGQEAIDILESKIPNLILMDIKMPKINGLEVTKLIKTNPKLQHIPIVMLSAHTEQPVVNECLKCGAVDYLIKPAQRKELLDRVTRFIKSDANTYPKAV